MAGILYQQDLGGFENGVLAIGKVGFRSGPHNEDALSSSHDLCVNEAPIIVTVEEI